jgi:hypothetical protein
MKPMKSGAPRFLSCWFFCALAACSGRSVELEDRHPRAADPSVIAAEPGVAALWVNDEHLYWQTDPAIGAARLRTCSKVDCAGTATAFADDQIVAAAPDRTSVYFVSSNPPNTLYACSADGCSSRRNLILRDMAIDGILAGDESQVYWLSAYYRQLYRCPASGCGAVPELVAELDQDVFTTQLVAAGDSLFYMDGTNTLARLQRVPKDGSSPPLTIATIANLSELNLAANSESVFWTDDTHSVWSCPLTGCASGPRRIVGPGNYRTKLAADDLGVYWLEVIQHTEDPSDFGQRVLACPLSGCSGAPTALTPESSYAFAVDRDHVYWSEVPSGPSSQVGHDIHRAARPALE